MGVDTVCSTGPATTARYAVEDERRMEASVYMPRTTVLWRRRRLDDKEWKYMKMYPSMSTRHSPLCSPAFVETVYHCSQNVAQIGTKVSNRYTFFSDLWAGRCRVCLCRQERYVFLSVFYMPVTNLPFTGFTHRRKASRSANLVLKHLTLLSR